MKMNRVGTEVPHFCKVNVLLHMHKYKCEIINNMLTVVLFALLICV